jgi:hypothetical protein
LCHAAIYLPREAKENFSRIEVLITHPADTRHSIISRAHGEAANAAVDLVNGVNCRRRDWVICIPDYQNQHYY